MYGTVQLKLDTCMVKLAIFSVSLSVTRIQLACSLCAHTSNVTSVVHWMSIL